MSALNLNKSPANSDHANLAALSTVKMEMDETKPEVVQAIQSLHAKETSFELPKEIPEAITAFSAVPSTALEADVGYSGEEDESLVRLRAHQERHQDGEPHDPRPTVVLRPRGPNKHITSYLSARVPAFGRLLAIREQGWNSSKCDDHFKTQRAKADTATPAECKVLFHMMIRIGEEIQSATSAFKINRRISYNSPQDQILDFCAAPGGFLQVALEANLYASATAFTLPVEQGGHPVRIAGRVLSERIDLVYQDITLLAADMGFTSIPADHPDAGKLLMTRLIPQGYLFDLVICDGQVLRTHGRAEYREPREARRLMTTQLALGLEHMREGGTMLVLLHKVERWEVIKLLYTLDRFSHLQLFKPRRTHATRSSFYLVAKHVRSAEQSAKDAVKVWKNEWRVATFESDQEYKELIRKDDCMVERVLEEFGEKLAKLGKTIWEIQASALKGSKWMKA